MTTLILLGLLAVGAADPINDPDVLVKNLSSGEEAVREDAAGALEELGRPALPALRKARETEDAGLRRRVSLLIDLIEHQRLMRGTLVKLDFEDRPLSEVLATLRSETGFRLELAPDAATPTQRIRLREAKPLPFWETLDRLGSLAGFRHNPGLPFAPQREEVIVPLIRNEGPALPASYAGPFRVNLVRLGRHRQVVPAAAGAKPQVEEQFSAELQLFAEPGLTIGQNGPLVLQTATDDQGQDLRGAFPGNRPRRPAFAKASPVLGARVYYPPPRMVEGNLSILSYTVPLRPWKPSGARLAKLKGFIPVTVITRADNPLVVPLAAAQGKSLSAGDVSLKITRFEREGEVTTIGLVLEGVDLSSTYGPRLGQAPLGDYVPPFQTENHIRLRDEQGRSCRRFQSQIQAGPAGTAQLVLTFKTGGDAGPPAELLYHEVVGSATEVVFEFDDLPLP